MQLVEAGTVEPDAEVSRYLDGFSGKPAGDVTIRQLLSHTSGFSTLQGTASHTDTAGGTDALERRVDLVAELTPAYESGERWEYSNTNYQILGRLIEVVSGQEYQDYIATQILAPVGMEHSFVADGDVHEAMATGHRPWFGTKRPLSVDTTDRGTAPQGGIVASASDLARYLQMHHRQGAGSGLRRRGCTDVAEDPVHRPRGSADRLPPEHVLGVALIATAVTGVMWSVFRLAVAYTGRSGPRVSGSPARGSPPSRSAL